MAGHPHRERLIGHLEDLQARLAALDADLRRITSMMVSPFLIEGPFTGAVEGLIGDFQARTGIAPELTVRGDFESLTDSQQITLLALIQEALHNVREHSGAAQVAISLLVEDRDVLARIEDDGRGFDPAATFGSAVREGHMGILGMHERVQMLGGTTKIDSRPGGPTIISARLPAQDIPGPAS
jgi:two-component system sensor histidine kinase UhpB